MNNFLKYTLVALILIVQVSVVYPQLKVGVALPLMKNSPGSPDASTGEMMLKGIKDAVNEYNLENVETKVEIIIKDTGKDPEMTIEALNSFGNDAKVMAVIGPVFSAELVNSAGAAEFHKLPVISPTATVNFIAEKNPYVFQLNPTYDVRGRLMAKYAIEKLGMNRFIILSEDTYGKQYAEGFAGEISSTSDSILFAKYYGKDQWDLSTEAADIRRYLEENDTFIDFGTINVSDLEKLRKIGLTKEMSDSLILKKYLVSIYKLPGGITPEVLSVSGVTMSPYNSRSFNVIFGIADAIYIPIARHDEIAKVALALFKQRINLPILGTSDWNNTESLMGSKDVLPKVYFEADFSLTNQQIQDVKNMNDSERRNYYFGLGSMQILLDLFSKGVTSKNEINDALELLKDYETPYNRITIRNRTNHSLKIMRFEKGSLEKIEDFVY